MTSSFRTVFGFSSVPGGLAAGQRHTALPAGTFASRRGVATAGRRSRRRRASGPAPPWAVRLVNHLVDGDKIVIGLTPGSAIATSAGTGGTVVAYEADALDLTERLGWSVVVVGMARLVADDDSVVRCRARLRPWLTGAMADILTISSEVVTGYRLVPSEPVNEIVRAAV
jgi:hypothetical protein